MFSASCSVTVVVLLLTVRRTNGASVTQTEGPVILSEGSSLTLNCNYQTSYSGFLFWYVQYLHEGPQLLLQSTTENQRMEHQGFHATLVKKDSSFHLHKSSLQLSDSAVYYCALGDTVRGTTEGVEHKPRGDARAQTVTQPDAQVAVSEGAAAELRCSYSQGTALYLFWYVQYPGQGPQLLLKYISGDARVPGIRGFEAEFKKSESSFHLRKASVQGSDAARYFCAVTATAPGPAGGAGHKPPEMLGRRNASERLCKSKEPGALPAEAPRDLPGPHGADALLVVGWGRCPGEF